MMLAIGAPSCALLRSSSDKLYHPRPVAMHPSKPGREGQWTHLIEKNNAEKNGPKKTNPHFSIFDHDKKSMTCMKDRQLPIFIDDKTDKKKQLPRGRV